MQDSKKSRFDVISQISVKTETRPSVILLTPIKHRRCFSSRGQYVPLSGAPRGERMRGGGVKAATGPPGPSKIQDGWTHKLQHMLWPPSIPPSTLCADLFPLKAPGEEETRGVYLSALWCDYSVSAYRESNTAKSCLATEELNNAVSVMFLLF